MAEARCRSTITDASGRTLSGQTTEAFWNSVRHARPITIGFNCALGAEDLRAHIADIGRVADTLVCAYPNAGLPNEFGQYDESPEYMAELLEEFAASGLVNILGDVLVLVRRQPGSTVSQLADLLGVGTRYVAAAGGRDERPHHGPGAGRIDAGVAGLHLDAAVVETLLRRGSHPSIRTRQRVLSRSPTSS